MFLSGKKNIVQIIFILFFFVLASKVDACSQLDSTKAIPAGFGASYDLILPGYTSLIKTDCSASSLSLEVGNNQSTQYIYKRGYYYRNGAWESFNFSNATATSDWIIGTANASIVLSEAERLGTNYVVAYICTWTGSEWKCGCRDKACANNFWQLQIFKYPSMSCFDADGDKYDTCSVGDVGDDNKALDCNDTKSAVNPGGLEVCDTFDNDCDGTVDEGCDDDKDLYCDSGMKLYGGNTMCTLTAFKGEGTSGSDCDDTNSSVNPGKTEVCDGVDNDCDKNTDEGCVCVDNDKDGYDTCGVGELGDDGKAEDCNDKAWERSPGAVEICDGVDNDCDDITDEGGVCCTDNDGDTYDTCSIGADGDDGKIKDCDDASWFMNPGAPETCDNYDNNCNGEKDENCDADGDGYCSSTIRFYNYPVSVCPKTNLANDSFGNDCSATDYNVNPGVVEKCNGIDDDCDTIVDENCSCTNGQTQACGIDTGACRVGSQTCANGTWGTCVGEIVAVTEVCSDSIDNDCDGQTDEGCSTCADNDKDGFDNCAIGTSGDDGKVIDCNDNEAWSNPGGVETCDSVDNNCSGVADEGCDDDRDRYCDSNMKLYGSNLMCPLTAFTVNGMNGNDCNDTNLNVYPGKTEVCGNSLDDNCSGEVDEGCSNNSMDLEITYPFSPYIYAKYGVYFSYFATNGKAPITYTLESDVDGLLYEGYNQTCSYDSISVGDHNIKVTAKDVDNSSVSKTIALRVYGDNEFFVPVYEPRDGKKYFLGDSIYFSADTGVTGNIDVQWTSNRDGLVATSNYAQVSDLSLGVHQITMVATDDNNQSYTEVFSIEVTDKPFLYIWQPNGSVEKGENYYISAMFYGESQRATFSLSSNIDGDIGNGLVLNTSRMTVGVHTITITGTSELNETASEIFTLEVKEPLCLDNDGDGYGILVSQACTSSIIDCNDNNVNINPGMLEDCDNGIDEDCDNYIDDCAVQVEMQLPNKDDIVIERGSLITIRAKAVGALYVSAKIQSPDGNDLSSVTLYDDGSHNDLLANDGVWASTWRAGGASEGRYYIDFSLLRNGYNAYEVTNNLRTFFLSEAPKCGYVHNSGSSTDKLDILLVPDQFETSELEVFYQKAQKVSDMLLSIEPFKTQQNKINIGWVEVIQNLGCDKAENGCTSANIIASAASCPWDEIVVMADSNFRSWATFGGYAMVDATDYNYDWVVTHELGHSFSSLLDEYVESGLGTSVYRVNSSVNCDSSSSCTKWSGVAGAGCFDGCDYNLGFYRSINSGLMRTSNAKDYGVVNINYLNTLLEKYK